MSLLIFRSTLLSTTLVIGLYPLVAAGKETNPIDIPAGHSYHGEAFNEGSRQKAYLMEGTGNVSFPVTTNSFPAQKFIDQSVGPLHGFWYFEAERSFRQAAGLDPECAIAYWDMAMSNINNLKRGRGFIAEAVNRKEGITQRSRCLSTFCPFISIRISAARKKRKLTETFKQLQESAGVADLDAPVLKWLAPLTEQLGFSLEWRKPMPQANDIGQRPDLNSLGPFRRSPYEVPDFTLKDVKGKVFSLKEAHRLLVRQSSYEVAILEEDPDATKKQKRPFQPGKHTKDSLEKVKKFLKENKAILLDVREKSEWDVGHLKGAKLVPLSELRKKAGDRNYAKKLGKKVPKKKIVYCHCRSGGRVIPASKILYDLGYDIRPLKFGYADLLKAGFPKSEKTGKK